MFPVFGTPPKISVLRRFLWCTNLHVVIKVTEGIFGIALSGVQDARRQALRSRFELAGESLREIGVLLIVFVPLDATFYAGELKFPAIVGLVLLALAGFAITVAGICLEGRD